VVSAAFQRAGFRAETPVKGKNGRYSINYKKPKAATVTVTFFPNLPKRPANPAAKSRITLTWQTRKAPARRPQQT
jgi:hypothetical protein